MSEAIVYIGKRPAFKYVGACLSLFHSGHDKVKVMARGLAIPKAIEVVERMRNHFMKDVVIEKIDLGSEVLVREGGTPKRVSVISIILRRG